MTNLTETPTQSELPQIISFIATTGVVLLPGGLLPYHAQKLPDLQAINAALKSGRHIGIVQPMKVDGDKMVLFRTGCLGKITTFTEGQDGSYFVIIGGLKSFSIVAQQRNQLQVNYLQPSSEAEPTAPHERIKLLNLLGDYLNSHGISVNWDDVATASDETLITSLAMMCPFEANEKQAILESKSLRERFQKLTAFLEVSQIKKLEPSLQIH